jgi:hypothetical protein
VSKTLATAEMIRPGPAASHQRNLKIKVSPIAPGCQGPKDLPGCATFSGKTRNVPSKQSYGVYHVMASVQERANAVCDSGPALCKKAFREPGRWVQLSALLWSPWLANALRLNFTQ